MPGLVSSTWKADRSFEISVIEPNGRTKLITIPASVFTGIDFDGDPRVWAPLLQAALVAFRPGFLGFVIVSPNKSRRIVDNGEGDISEEITWSAGIGIHGNYDGR